MSNQSSSKNEATIVINFTEYAPYFALHPRTLPSRLHGLVAYLTWEKIQQSIKLALRDYRKSPTGAAALQLKDLRTSLLGYRLLSACCLIGLMTLLVLGELYASRPLLIPGGILFIFLLICISSLLQAQKKRNIAIKDFAVGAHATLQATVVPQLAHEFPSISFVGGEVQHSGLGNISITLLVQVSPSSSSSSGKPLEEGLSLNDEEEDKDAAVAMPPMSAA